MKIIAFQEFLKLPTGTLFSYYEPCVFRGLYIKDDSIGHDFIYHDLIAPIDSTDSEDYLEKAQLGESGVDVALDFNFTSREGLFDDNQLYAVYSQEDLKQLIKELQRHVNLPTSPRT